MKINHIVWNTPDWTQKTIAGLLELRVYWHGGDRDIIVMEGVFDTSTDTFTNVLTGKLNKDTVGVAGISLQRVGTIVE